MGLGLVRAGSARVLIEGGRRCIWLVSSAGGPLSLLGAEGPHQTTPPGSPDGRLVAFVRSSAAGPHQSLMVVVETSTSAKTVVLNDVVHVEWTPEQPVTGGGYVCYNGACDRSNK